MRKKLKVMLVLALTMLPSFTARSVYGNEESSPRQGVEYESEASIGFYGEWESPDEDEEATRSPTPPQEQTPVTRLPETGAVGNSVLMTVGLSLFSMAVIFKIISIKENNRNEKN
ncbi:MAG: LPXTG cell wall anchor domain-containing protein [Turicibacter sp.]|nr:LPXTG cell wall anchor domain-containing protein [Turicibacter sp.]